MSSARFARTLIMVTTLIADSYRDPWLMTPPPRMTGHLPALRAGRGISDLTLLPSEAGETPSTPARTTMLGRSGRYPPRSS